MIRVVRGLRAGAMALLLHGCSEPTPIPVLPRPALLVATTPLPTSAVVGTSAGTLRVQVLDLNGVGLSGVAVAFNVTRGAGVLSRQLDTTDATGAASTEFRVGTAIAQNQVSAIVDGLPPLTFTVSGTAGPARKVALPVRVRFMASQDSVAVSFTVRDTFNNLTTGAPTWTPRNGALVTAAAQSATSVGVKVLSRPGATWVVASLGGAGVDSVHVIVEDATTTPCSFLATPTTLAVGASMGFVGGFACVQATDPGAEYAVIAHLNTAAQSVSQSLTVTGTGITTAQAPFPDAQTVASVLPDAAFEARLRDRERTEIAPRLAGARSWFASLRSAPANAAAVRAARAVDVLPSEPREGDEVALNVDALKFCSTPDLRTARIAAVTNNTIVMADLDNPSGGFTDTEYRQFGLQFDTLVNPLITTAFGAPTDVDANGKVAVLFTRAVNELTSQGSPTGIVLGYYYLRDLLPRLSPFGNCPGSNVGEMFYVIVPDPAGQVNGNTRTKAFVQNAVVATIAHEYQHLINASRRMYITNAPQVDEEVWLNEGLSHIAEELVFYRSGAVSPRQNIGGAQLALGSTTRTAFDQYNRSNYLRYREYLKAPESNSPLAGDDVLATRGATWSFLRYVVDRARSSDGDFWRTLVDAPLVGVVNLDAALSGTGVTTMAALRDWSVSVIADDNPGAVNAVERQGSWNFISVADTLVKVSPNLSFPLVPRLLTNTVSAAVGLVGGGSSYLRFGVPQNQEALLAGTAFPGGPLPGGIRLTVIRIK